MTSGSSRIGYFSLVFIEKTGLLPNNEFHDGSSVWLIKIKRRLFVHSYEKFLLYAPTVRSEVREPIFKSWPFPSSCLNRDLQFIWATPQSPLTHSAAATSTQIRNCPSPSPVYKPAFRNTNQNPSIKFFLMLRVNFEKNTLPITW